jgi:hypothetical protein
VANIEFCENVGAFGPQVQLKSFLLTHSVAVSAIILSGSIPLEISLYISKVAKEKIIG